MRTAIDFLIDISDNMSKKLDIAQRAIKEEIIPLLDFSDCIGIRTFISIAKSPIVINSIDLGETNRHDFTEKIEKLPMPNAGSPIAYTVKQSLESLNKLDVDRKRIILVTAGIETDGGNYEFEVEKNSKVDNVQVNIIGLGLSGFEEKTAQKTADISHGCFCNIPLDKGNDSIAISNILQPLKDILNGKEAYVAPAPKTEPAPTATQEPIIEIREERIAEPITQPVVQPIVQPVAEPIAQPVVETRPKVEVEVIASPKREESKVEAKAEPAFKPADRKDMQFKAEATDALGAFASPSTESDMEFFNNQLAKNNAQIEKLLKQNAHELQSFAQKQQESDKEIAELRAAGQKAIATIEELKRLNGNANSEIDRLETLLSQAQAEVKKLAEQQASATEEIRRLKKIDEDVIIFQDSDEISKNSRKNESQIYETLEKRYPGRVNWVNKEEKKNLGYDFEIKFDDKSVEYFIAGKGIDEDRTFFLTKTEWEKCLKHSRNYQVYLVNKENRIAIIDNLIGCILSGKVHPLAEKNKKVKAGSVQFSID